MQSPDYKYQYNSKHLADFDWEDTLLKHLRDTIEIERLVVKDGDDSVLFDGAPNDLPDNLLLAKCRKLADCEYGEHLNTYSMYAIYVDAESTPSYFELANRCIEDDEVISQAKSSAEDDKAWADEDKEIVRGLLKLALRKRVESRVNLDDLIHNIAFVLDIKLDGPAHEQFVSYYAD